MDLRKLSRLLKQLTENDPAITIINLSNKKIDDVTAEQIAEALKTNTIVTTLNLSNNQIGLTGIQALVRVLKVNQTITTVDFNCNNLGTVGAIVLAEVLKVNRSITTLSLNDNDTHEEGIIALAEALKTNDVLVSMELREANMKPEVLNTIHQALYCNKLLRSADQKTQKRMQTYGNATRPTNINLLKTISYEELHKHIEKISDKYQYYPASGSIFIWDIWCMVKRVKESISYNYFVKQLNLQQLIELLAAMIIEHSHVINQSPYFLIRHINVANNFCMEIAQLLEDLTGVCRFYFIFPTLKNLSNDRNKTTLLAPDTHINHLILTEDGVATINVLSCLESAIESGQLEHTVCDETGLFLPLSTQESNCVIYHSQDTQVLYNCIEAYRLAKAGKIDLLFLWKMLNLSQQYCRTSLEEYKEQFALVENLLPYYVADSQDILENAHNLYYEFYSQYMFKYLASVYPILSQKQQIPEQFQQEVLDYYKKTCFLIIEYLKKMVKRNLPNYRLGLIGRKRSLR